MKHNYVTKKGSRRKEKRMNSKIVVSFFLYLHRYSIDLYFRQEQIETDDNKELEGEEKLDNLQLSLRDEVKRITPIKLSGKPKSVALVVGSGSDLRVSITLGNNKVELYAVQINSHNTEAKCLRSVSNQGHPSHIKTVSFSSDNLAIVSGSSECIKMWNRPTQSCLRTIETG